MKSYKNKQGLRLLGEGAFCLLLLLLLPRQLPREGLVIESGLVEHTLERESRMSS